MNRRLLAGFSAIGLLSTLAFAQVSQPVTEVIGVDDGFVFLKVPTSFVNHCLPGTEPLIQAYAEHFSRRNGASNRLEKITINPDGTYTPEGSNQPAVPNPELETSVFYKRFKCEIPVLTSEQLKANRLEADWISSVPSYAFSQIPENIIDYRDTDLVLSKRDRDFKIPGFTFNKNFSGGIDPYLKGSSIGRIIENPAPYGLNAVYYTLAGECDRTSSVSELNARCSDAALRDAADQASRGVGITILSAR